ncbi:MAG: SAM-dependent methyltransferase, partial [Tepidisphaeraceae bacterium]
ALDWKLRNDPRVIVMERTNAMHVDLPEQIDMITIDVAWTRQKSILPSARHSLSAGGSVVTLIKPHYEAEPGQLRGGVLPAEELDGVLERVKTDIRAAGFELQRTALSPIKGAKGNVEVLALLRLLQS